MEALKAMIETQREIQVKVQQASKLPLRWDCFKVVVRGLNQNKIEIVESI